MRGLIGPRVLPRSQTRFNSQSTATGQKEVSPHVGFYKTFGGPILKVLLMATFTYQLSYWLWVKLENDEIKSQQTAEIEALESKLKEVMGKKEA